MHCPAKNGGVFALIGFAGFLNQKIKLILQQLLKIDKNTLK
jgi:hypothetical protein